MSIIFSKKCEYAIQAVLYLSSLASDKVVNAHDIADELKIPKEFISKILQELTFSGIIDSKKGKGGGFSLAKSPQQIKLIDIVYAVDGDGIFHQCVLGFPNCTSDAPCPVHDKWSALISETNKILSNETIDHYKDLVIKKIEFAKNNFQT